MPWNDASETVVAGSGEVYVAAVGTALPANAGSALNAAFKGLGYHTEDGVSVNEGKEITEFRAWQELHPIRRERDSQEFQIAFQLLQWNEETLPLAMGGGAVTDLGGGQFKYTPPEDTAELDERALVVDVEDGTRKGRFVIPRGTVTEGVESTFRRSEMAILPITFKALAPETGGDPWFFLTNDSAAFATGS